MGKKHRQPPPIASPIDVLAAGMASSRPTTAKRPRTGADAATPSATSAVSPVGSHAPLFPRSPPRGAKPAQHRRAGEAPKPQRSAPPTPGAMSEASPKKAAPSGVAVKTRAPAARDDSDERVEDYGDAASSEASSVDYELANSEGDFVPSSADSDASSSDNSEELGGGSDAADEEDDETEDIIGALRPPGRGKRAAHVAGTAELDDADDEDEMLGDDEGDGAEGDAAAAGESVTVHFAAMAPRPRDIEAITHLMDALVPDHMNEVDRDALGAAIVESPLTTLVRVNASGDSDEDEDDDDDEPTEIYGMATAIDVAYRADAHPAALQALLKLLSTSVWRVAAPGIPVAELLGRRGEDGRSRAVLLVGQYITNVPTEIVSRVLAHTLDAFAKEAAASIAADQPTAAGAEKPAQKKRRGDADGAVATAAASVLRCAFPCMFIVLAKIQRATHRAKAEGPKGAKRGGTDAAGAASQFDLRDYVFWRDEDSVLYSFRDTRVAASVYRCRPQYEEQPEPERPLTIAFGLTNEGAAHALAEIRKRETIAPL